MAPSFAFTSDCHSSSTAPSAIDVCMDAAVPDFDKARAAEGLPNIVLPDDFDTLSVPEQVLALTDIERVDRGLPPAPGLSSSLNQLAQQGANAQTDPAFPQPSHGTGEQSNWAGTGSSLLGVFLWMYDDGPGSGNLDCTATNSSGCWGHRHTILGSYDTPIAMGAAVADPGGSRASLTEELIGGDSTDTVDQSPTWDQIAATQTFGLDPLSLTFDVGEGQSASAQVTATSAEVGNLTPGITFGGAPWSVSPSGCAVTVHSACTFTVRFDPPQPGHYSGILTISDGANGKTVALVGDVEPPQVSISITGRRALTVHGHVETGGSQTPVSGMRVILQKRTGAGSPWRTIGAATSGRFGNVTFHPPTPTRTSSYRLEALSATGAVEARSPAVRVTVRR
jgi:hypothetical protein